MSEQITSRYPGMKPFEAHEWQIFFGRKTDTQSLYDLIGIEKTVLFYSKSGLGKSSLINAGLIPMLLEDKRFKFRPVVFRFNARSGQNIISPKVKILDQLKKIATGSRLLDFPELIENTLSFWLKAIQFMDPEQTHVLIFDQFEELFTYPDAQINELEIDLNELLYLKTSALFRENLLRLAESEPDNFSEDQLNMLMSSVNIRMLFAIRSDKLSMLNRLTGNLPNLQRTFYELGPMTREEARLAIEKPADSDGDFTCPKFKFEKKAVDNILDALQGNEGQAIETFQLQLVCQYAENLVLKNPSKTLISPEDLGDLKNIHQSFYYKLMEDLPVKNEEEKTKLLEFLGKEFISESGKIRQLVLKSDIPKEISEKALSFLEQKRLIRSETYDKREFYELSHDTLIEPIFNSYRRRKEELAKIEADNQISVFKRKVRRQRIQIVIVALAALISIGFAVFGFLSWDKAEKSLEELIKAKSLMERQKDTLELVNQKYEEAAKQRTLTEINNYIDDARNFELYGYLEDACRSIKEARKLDSTNIQVDLLYRKYCKMESHDEK
jgi:hypothetical protein